MYFVKKPVFGQRVEISQGGGAKKICLWCSVSGVSGGGFGGRKIDPSLELAVAERDRGGGGCSYRACERWNGDFTAVFSGV